jgi:hypothetical protein
MPVQRRKKLPIRSICRFKSHRLPTAFQARFQAPQDVITGTLPALRRSVAGPGEQEFA